MLVVVTVAIWIFTTTTEASLGQGLQLWYLQLESVVSFPVGKHSGFWPAVASCIPRLWKCLETRIGMIHVA